MNHTWPAQLAAGRWPLQADALRTADAYAGERRPSRSAAPRAGRLPFAAPAGSPPSPAAACSPLALGLLGCVRGARAPCPPAAGLACASRQAPSTGARDLVCACAGRRPASRTMEMDGDAVDRKHRNRIGFANCYVLLAGWALGFTLLGRHTLFLGPTREEPDARSSSTSSLP